MRKEYFCAEQKSGIIKSSALVFPLYSEEVEISKNVAYELIVKINMNNLCSNEPPVRQA